jgi:hypothetical protein
LSVQRKHTLRCNKYGWDLELLKEDFKHLLALLGGIHIRLGEQDGILIGGNSKKRIRVLPQQLHIIPVLNNPVIYGILKLKHTPLVTAYLITHVYIRLVFRGWDDHLILWSTYTGLLV